MKKTSKIRIKSTRTRLAACVIAFIALFLGFICTSCNVTRTVTTQSQYFTKGDTTCTIVTKTIETYDATKH